MLVFSAASEHDRADGKQDASARRHRRTFLKIVILLCDAAKETRSTEARLATLADSLFVSPCLWRFSPKGDVLNVAMDKMPEASGEFVYPRQVSFRVLSKSPILKTSGGFRVALHARGASGVRPLPNLFSLNHALAPAIGIVLGDASLIQDGISVELCGCTEHCKAR